MQPDDSVVFVEHFRCAVLAALAAPLTPVECRHPADVLHRLGDEQMHSAELDAVSAAGGEG